MNNSRIEQMVVSGSANDGIYLYGRHGQCDGNTIVDCTISGNSNYGVYLYGAPGQCYRNRVHGNQISKNALRPGSDQFRCARGNRPLGELLTGRTASRIPVAPCPPNNNPSPSPSSVRWREVLPGVFGFATCNFLAWMIS